MFLLCVVLFYFYLLVIIFLGNGSFIIFFLSLFIGWWEDFLVWLDVMEWFIDVISGVVLVFFVYMKDGNVLVFVVFCVCVVLSIVWFFGCFKESIYVFRVIVRFEMLDENGFDWWGVGNLFWICKSWVL